MKRFRVAVLGCGDIAVAQHLPALVSHPRFEVAVVADPIVDRAEKAGRVFAVPRVVGNASDALAADVDVAVIATPPHITPGLAITALERGLHVLCEKPLGTELAEADAVVAAALRPGAPLLQVGFKNRFAPLVMTLHERVKMQWFGQPLLVRISSFDEHYAPTDHLHTERIRGFLRTGPPVVHEGAHATDLLGWLLGPPTEIQGVAFQSDPDFPAPNYHCAEFRWRNGSLAKLEVGWWFPHLWPGELQVYGPRGVADLSRPEGRLRLHDGQHEEVFTMGRDWQRVCFRGQLDAFARSIDAGRVDPNEAADALAGRQALQMSLGAVEAARSGHTLRNGWS